MGNKRRDGTCVIPPWVFIVVGDAIISHHTSSISHHYFFDLQGRKVTNPEKGKIYILNGKKVKK